MNVFTPVEFHIISEASAGMTDLQISIVDTVFIGFLVKQYKDLSVCASDCLTDLQYLYCMTKHTYTLYVYINIPCCVYVYVYVHVYQILPSSASIKA